LQTVNLGDTRRDERLGEVLTQLGARPTGSIPAACGGPTEMTAAYRLFDNPKVSFEAVLAPHAAATRRRMAAHPRAVLVPDTTELDLTRPRQTVAGAGPLDGGARRGLFMHLLHAFTPDGTPLGTLEAVCWARAEAPVPAPSQAQRAARRKKTPIEEKESMRWLQGLRRARAEAERVPATRLVCVSDSESDIYEVLAEADAASPILDWIVRAGQNRAVEPGAAPPPETEALTGRLRETLGARPVLFTHTVKLRARQAKVKVPVKGRGNTRPARTAAVEVRAGRVTLQPPWRPDRTLAPVTVNAVLVSEPSPPAGQEPVEWLLLTNLPIDTRAAVRAVIALYGVRWMIEVVFRTLKTGCRVEQRRFEHADRVLRCLAVYLIVAWRTLYVCRLGRRCPELSCEVLFAPEEWKPVYRTVRGLPPPATAPSLQEMVQWVAQLGGYVPRKNSPPGPQTVWLGLQRMYDLSLCWQLFGPEAKNV
jgi:hypothetical protein